MFIGSRLGVMKGVEDGEKLMKAVEGIVHKKDTDVIIITADRGK